MVNGESFIFDSSENILDMIDTLTTTLRRFSTLMAIALKNLQYGSVYGLMFPYQCYHETLSTHIMNHNVLYIFSIIFFI